MKAARIRGALVGVEAVTPEGLKDVYKDFNTRARRWSTRLRAFKDAGVHVLGSFIFGLPCDRPQTFEATSAIATARGVTFAQFVMLTPFPGTVDFAAWEKTMESDTHADRRGAADATLADSAGAAAEGLHPAPGDGSGRDSPPHAGGVGRFLQPAEDLGAIELRRVAEVADGVRAHFEAVSADVCEHRDCDRQRAREPFGALGADDRDAVQAAVFGAADARFAGAGLENPKSRGGLYAAPSFPPLAPRPATLAIRS